MPELTQNQWIILAIGVAAAVILYRKGAFGWLMQKAPPAPAVAPPPVLYQSAPAVVTLDDQVLSAASVIKGVSEQRRNLKDAYSLIDAHDAAVLELKAKEQARINALAAGVKP